MVDSRFVYGSAPKWQNGLNQKLQGSEFLTIQPSNKTPTLYEFELANMNSVILFGPHTGFRIKACFEAKATDAAADNTYGAIPLEDYAKVVVQPNWFENLIKSIDVFHNNQLVKCDDVPRYADHILNGYLYANMDPEVKDYLFPEEYHPSRSVPFKKGGWAPEADSEWHAYSKTIFNKGIFEFRYVPMHVFPFFQHPDFGALGGRLPAAIPMSALDKMTITINFKEDFNDVFRKIGAEADQTKKVFRLRITSIDLVVEEARLQPTFERSLVKSPKPLLFDGATRYGMVENISPGVRSHRVELPKIEMPEGIFIFALSNKVIGGEYKYKDLTTATLDTFKKTNIESLNLTWNGMPLNVKALNPGQIRDHFMGIKQYFAHKERPPFGVTQDVKRLKLDMIRDCGDESEYPHIYYDLCPSTNATRTIPIGDEGKSINQPGELHINIQFRNNGAVANTTYYIYAFYTDINMVMDLKNKSFYPFYKKIRTAF